jgi:hypothetical protein
MSCPGTSSGNGKAPSSNRRRSTTQGNFLLDEFEKLLSDRTRLVAITQMSNVLGTVVPVKAVVRLAHERGIFRFWSTVRKRRCT